MPSIQLHITGMHCDHCVKKVTDALQGVAGVYGAAVDLAGGVAEVDCDAAQASEDRLVRAVEAVGYGANAAS